MSRWSWAHLSLSTALSFETSILQILQITRASLFQLNLPELGNSGATVRWMACRGSSTLPPVEDSAPTPEGPQSHTIPTHTETAQFSGEHAGITSMQANAFAAAATRCASVRYVIKLNQASGLATHPLAVGDSERPTRKVVLSSRRTPEHTGPRVHESASAGEPVLL